MSAEELNKTLVSISEIVSGTMVFAELSGHELAKAQFSLRGPKIVTDGSIGRDAGMVTQILRISGNFAPTISRAMRQILWHDIVRGEVEIDAKVQTSRAENRLLRFSAPEESQEKYLSSATIFFDRLKQPKIQKKFMDGVLLAARSDEVFSNLQAKTNLIYEFSDDDVAMGVFIKVKKGPTFARDLEKIWGIKGISIVDDAGKVTITVEGEEAMGTLKAITDAMAKTQPQGRSL